jgi:hypothetical protein
VPNLIGSRLGVIDHGEVFTPPWVVGAMLDLVKSETDRIDSRFLEPACGSGNFPVAALRRKLGRVEVRYGNNAFEKRQGFRPVRGHAPMACLEVADGA